jgi:hypothetical protein
MLSVLVDTIEFINQAVGIRFVVVAELAGRPVQGYLIFLRQKGENGLIVPVFDEIRQISFPRCVRQLGKDLFIARKLQPFLQELHGEKAFSHQQECGIALGALPESGPVAIHPDKTIPFRPRGIDKITVAKQEYGLLFPADLQQWIEGSHDLDAAVGIDDDIPLGQCLQGFQQDERFPEPISHASGLIEDGPVLVIKRGQFYFFKIPGDDVLDTLLSGRNIQPGPAGGVQLIGQVDQDCSHAKTGSLK